MGDLSRDRFGVPIEPKTHQFKTPGPGAYESDNIDSVKRNQFKYGVFDQEDRNFNFGIGNSLKNPGPAYYNPTIVDKISFHYDRMD